MGKLKFASIPSTETVSMCAMLTPAFEALKAYSITVVDGEVLVDFDSGAQDLNTSPLDQG